MRHTKARHQLVSHRRKGAAIVLIVVALPMLLGMAALTIDVGVLFATRADLQNAADAASLAAASALTTDSMMRVRMYSGNDAVMDEALADVRAIVDRVVNQISSMNHSFGTSHTVIEAGDIVLGWIDTTSGTSPLVTTVPASEFNAVQVSVRRTAAGTNAPVSLFFAPIFGRNYADVTATAVAVFNDNFSSYDTSSRGPRILPFTIHESRFEDEFANGIDSYSFDGETNTVSSSGDGIREVVLFPSEEAPGNRGLINVGLTEKSTDDLSRQIVDGISPEEFEAGTGSSVLTFYDDDGHATTYDIPGNPGMKSALEDSLLTLTGEVVAFFTHDSVSGSGSNAVYRITSMRFGRLMYANLSKSEGPRGLWIQPITLQGDGVITDLDAPPSGGMAGSVVLAR